MKRIWTLLRSLPGHVNSTLLVLLGATVAIGIYYTALQVTYSVPYLYTRIHGDENTKLLYRIYNHAQKKPAQDRFERFLMETRVHYSLDKGKSQYIISSSSRADVVYVTFKENRVTAATFSPD